MPRVEIRNGARLAAALGLGLTLSLGAAPVVALAEGVVDTQANADQRAGGIATVNGVECTTLEDVLEAAQSAAQAGQTVSIQLLSDIEGTEDAGFVIPEGMTVNLDLNGCSLIGKNAGSWIVNYGSLTISDETGRGCVYTKNTDAQGRHAIENHGTLIINGGIFGDKNSEPSDVNNVQRGNAVRNFGVATINGGRFTACDNYTKNGFAYAIANGDSSHLDAQLVINDATVYGRVNGLIASDAGTLVVKGGTFTLGSGSETNLFYMVYTSGSGSILVEGGTFFRNAKNSNGFFFGDVAVSDGTFEDKVNDSIEIASGTTVISGGSFTNTLAAKENASLKVSGGKFTAGIDDKYLVPGVSYDASSDTVTPNANNIATVTDEDGALVGMYGKLSEAVDAVPDGGTVTLTKAASGDGVVVESGTNFTLDLGGFTYTVDGETVGSPDTETNGFQLLKDSDITIKNGAITSENAKILIQNYSNLKLEDVALSGGTNTKYVLSNNNGETHIGEGTTITAAEGNVAFDVCRFADYPSVSVYVDKGAGEIKGVVELSDGGTGAGTFALTINGGDFTEAPLKYVGTTVADAITVKKDSSVEVPAPEGYRWVDEGDGPTLEKIAEGGQDDFKAVAQIGDVQYESLATAVEQARSGQTVELLADIELEEALRPAAGITIEGNNKTISLKAEIADGPFIDVQNDGVTIKNVTINTNGNAKHGVQFYCVEGGSLENCTINGGSYTSVQVNNSTKIKVSDCNLNPAASDEKRPYANIELSVGANIVEKVTPSLDVTGQAEPSNGLPFVYVDADTMARVLGKENGDSLSDDDKRQAINRLNENLSGAQLSLADDGNATGEKPHTPVAPPAQTGERVEVEQPEGGRVSVSPSRADEGETVTVTVTPDEGREAVSVTVADGDGNVVEVKPGEKDGTWTFEMPDCAVTVTAETRCDGGDLCPSRGLADVVVGEWYHDAVDWAIDAGVMSGYGHVAAFGPSDPISRAQLAQVLWNRAGRPDADASAVGQFPDCSADEFYAEAVAWCSESGIMTGYEDGYFGPSDEVTREQLATVLWRAAGSPEADTDLSAYPDAADVSEFAEGAMAWAVEIGAVSGQGSDGTLDPVGTLERAQCAMVLYRLDG